MNALVIALFALVAGATAAAIEKQPEFIPIVSQSQDVSVDGSFSSAYETANGIRSEERGQLINPGQKDEAQVIEGSASWTSPEGIPITLRWTAGPNGVVFEGAHLPLAPEPPAIPEAIQRSLEYNKLHPWTDESEKKQ